MPQREKRVAVVTGGAQGLGAAIAERLARNDVQVVVADIQEETARNTARALPAGEPIGLGLDVSDERSVADLYEEVDSRFGRLDILVNNAGISGARVPLEEMQLADWESTLRINLTGSFLMSRGAIALMRRHQWGRIVNVSSQAARSRTGVGKCQYAASKAGMIGFSRVLAEEVGKFGITVNCVCPSRTRTSLTLVNAARDSNYYASAIAQTPLGRIAEPSDTASAVAYFCSEEAGFVTGAVLDVTGGAFMP